MKDINQLTEEIRKLIHPPRKKHAVIEWNMLCSCLDVIEDTDSCLDAFLMTDLDRFDDGDQYLADGNKYMYVYGTLQALYMQQYAVEHLTESLKIPDAEDPSLKKITEDPSLKKIREIRNASVGHPTKQDRPPKEPVRFNFISRISIGKQGFKLGTAYADGRPDCFRDIDIPKLIETQRGILIGVLKNVIKALQKEGVG